MTALSRSARWAALEDAWVQAAATSARRTLGAVAWQALGACGTRTELPWTAEPDQVGPWDAESMRALCKDCPVLADCAAYVEDTAVCAGWWAGTNRDPSYTPPARPGWVPVRARHSRGEAQQGLLPLPIASPGGDAA